MQLSLSLWYFFCDGTLRSRAGTDDDSDDHVDDDSCANIDANADANVRRWVS
jgi:hypothetical protein